MSKEFHNQCDEQNVKYHIEGHHRHWVEASFKETIEAAKGKPVIFDEYFAMREQLSLQQVKDLADLALSTGLQGFCYYGVRDSALNLPGLHPPFDPFDWWKMVEYAGQLAKSLNQ